MVAVVVVVVFLDAYFLCPMCAKKKKKKGITPRLGLYSLDLILGPELSLGATSFAMIFVQLPPIPSLSRGCDF